MTEVTEMTKTAIREITSMYKSNVSLIAGDLVAEKQGKIFSGYVVLRDGELTTEGYDSNNDTPVGPYTKFMIGSVTKLFGLKVLASKLAGGDPGASLFPVSKSLVREAIKRGQLGHMEAMPEVYGVILKWLNLPLTEATDSKRLNWDKPDFPEVKLTFKELCFWTLSVSTDSGFVIARNYYVQNYGTFEQLQSEVASLVPSLELTRSSANFEHWIQSGANTVEISDMTAGMDVIAAEVTTEPFSAEVKSAITDSTIDFGFNFSATPEAKALTSEGNSVLEKTGLYPNVTWIRALAAQGFPAHMSICSALSISKSNGPRITVGMYMSVEMAMPTKLSELGYPDDSTPEYDSYIEAMKSKYFPIFRQNLVELVLQNR